MAAVALEVAGVRVSQATRAAGNVSDTISGRKQKYDVVRVKFTRSGNFVRLHECRGSGGTPERAGAGSGD